MHIYRFLTGPDDSSFCHKVTKALSEGWVLYGSPSMGSGSDGKPICGQAVTKDVGDVKYHPAIKLSEY